MNTATLATYFGADNAPPLRSVFDLIEVSCAGLPKKAVANVARHLSIPLADLFVTLHISIRACCADPARTVIGSRPLIRPVTAALNNRRTADASQRQRPEQRKARPRL